MALMTYRRGGDPADSATQDPMKGPQDEPSTDALFYRGKSPVLGQDVSVQTQGSLPGAFPEAGGGGRPPVQPTKGGAFPQFPGFSFDWSLGEGPMPPQKPEIPNFNIQGPGGGGAPWWATAKTTAETLGDTIESARKMSGLGGTGMSPGFNTDQFSLYGYPGGGSEWFNTPGEPTFSLTGPESAEALDTSRFNLGMGTPSPGFMSQYGFPGAQAIGGLYGAATQRPGSPGHLASSANAVGGLAALGANAGILPAAMAGLGPAAAAVSAPLLIGPPIGAALRGDQARWPKGYQFIPGSASNDKAGAMAVDPATGAILQYKGNGQYQFSDFTRQGNRATPEMFRQWEITPTGQLAQDTAYAGLGKELSQRRLSRPSGQEAGALAPGSGGATEADRRSAAQSAREPTIARLRAQYPNASEGELWRLYTQTPEYQQEQQQYPAYTNDR